MASELIASYDQDSKRFHRYIIDEGQGIVGNIYIPKDEEIPKELTIRLRLKELSWAKLSRLSYSYKL